jgi:beta-phosphoglucomutase-like phosphatase (HAD superfamily)
MTKAAIFDVDGTLVDSVDLHASAWQEALVKFGHNVTFEQARSQIGKGGDQLIPVFLSEADQKDHGAEIEDWRSKLFRSKYLPLVRPFSAVPELLRRVREAGLQVAVASSAKKSELEVYLKIACIKDLVDVATSSEDAEQSKPAPDIFQVALKKLGIEGPEASRNRRYTIRCRGRWQSRNSHHRYAVRRLYRSRTSRRWLRRSVSRAGCVARLLRGLPNGARDVTPQET